MKTYNIYFENIERLDSFIENNSDIQRADSLLIQVFSGILSKTTILNIAKFLKMSLPKAKIIGCTTSGEILDSKVSDKKIVISFTIFEKSTISINYADERDSHDSFELGTTLALRLKREKSKLFILFASGLQVNGEEFLSGIKSKAKNVLVAGGLSADNGTFTRTYLIYDNKVLDFGAVGVSINSDYLNVYSDYSLAWADIGKTFIVNKSDKKRVYEIDNMTPYELYSKYLGEDVAKLLPNIGVEFPLIMEKSDGTKVARAVLGINDDESFEFAGNIPNGTKVKFSIGSIDSLVSGSAQLAKDISIRLNSQSIFIYSCMARKVFLGQESVLDIKNFSSICSVAGFFTYGEFYTSKDEMSLLNQTLTLVALSEDSIKSKKINIDDNYNESMDVIRHKALSCLINKTSSELENLNVQLEEKVKEKTKKLQILNNDLENKILDEVEKNREKDIRLFEQAKMIQMNEMLKNIAHQWRQPLNLISTCASGVKLNYEFGLLSEDEIPNTMDTILTETENLSNTIEKMIGLVTKSEKDCQIPLEKELNNTIEVLESTLDDYDIKLKKDFMKGMTLGITQGELPHVLTNIISNAKDIFEQRSIENREIKIKSIKKDNKIQISIEDNAGGIDKNVYPRLFDPYFTTKHQSIGTGLGLHLCQRIVRERLKGNIYAQNITNGARFIIELPL